MITLQEPMKENCGKHRRKRLEIIQQNNGNVNERLKVWRYKSLYIYAYTYININIYIQKLEYIFSIPGYIFKKIK